MLGSAAACRRTGREIGHAGAMQVDPVLFTTIRWGEVPTTIHPGASGEARWRTVEAGALRVRIVEYSPGYVADHWCERGHVILVVAGALTTELADGRRFELGAGDSYHVSDGAPGHRSSTATGATLFIVD